MVFFEGQRHPSCHRLREKMNNTKSTGAASRAVESVERLLYTTAQVCQALGLSRTSVWKLEKLGVLKPLPHIRTRLYSVEAVRALAQNRT